MDDNYALDSAWIVEKARLWEWCNRYLVAQTNALRDAVTCGDKARQQEILECLKEQGVDAKDALY